MSAYRIVTGTPEEVSARVTELMGIGYRLYGGPFRVGSRTDSQSLGLSSAIVGQAVLISGPETRAAEEWAQ